MPLAFELSRKVTPSLDARLRHTLEKSCQIQYFVTFFFRPRLDADEVAAASCSTAHSSANRADALSAAWRKGVPPKRGTSRGSKGRSSPPPSPSLISECSPLGKCRRRRVDGSGRARRAWPRARRRGAAGPRAGGRVLGARAIRGAARPRRSRGPRGAPTPPSLTSLPTGSYLRGRFLVLKCATVVDASLETYPS